MVSLPPEVLEIILSQLPATDLFGSARQVCQGWREIVDRPKFIPWKKGLHSYTTRNILEGEEIKDLVKEFETSWSDTRYGTSIGLEKVSRNAHEEEEELAWNPKLELALPWLIGFVTKTFKNPNFYSDISKHSLHQSALLFFQSRMPDLSVDVLPLASVTTIACLATDVWEIREMIKILIQSNQIKSHQMTEVLYCIAFAFKYFNRTLGLPLRFVHNLVHALYLYEQGVTSSSSITPGISLTPSPKKRKLTLMDFGFKKDVVGKSPTSEQARIINHPIDKSKSYWVRIKAFAGTGKTTTLIKMCEAHPELKFLLVVYNKSAKEYAKKHFPQNVHCLTSHGLAFKRCGFAYAKKLKSKINARDLTDSDLITDGSVATGFGHYQQRAAQVAKTIENFVNSSDSEITLNNVPETWKNYNVDDNASTSRFPSIPHGQRDLVLQDSIKVWEAMKDQESKVPISHDGYMKVFQLRKPNLQSANVHDVLLIDEGQDMNPTMLEIFKNQGTPKVIVGDPNQQIYRFRGAVNALDSIPAEVTFHLTQSFRFGPEIAFIANCCLVTKGADKQHLIGGKKIDKLIKSKSDSFPKGYGRNIAIIARTNSALLKKAISLICKKGVTGESQKTGHFVGGIDGYNLQDFLDLLYIKNGQREKVNKWAWKKFKSYEDLKAHAKDTNDIEILGKIELVNEFDSSLESHFTKLQQFCKPTPKNEKNADYVFTTAHKAKGMEWETVQLLNDFQAMSNFSGNGQEDDESNLLYVAITRAKKNLLINDAVCKLLHRNSYFFERIETVFVAKVLETCKKCAQEFRTAKDLYLFSEFGSYPPFNGQGEGLLCRPCSSELIRSITWPVMSLFDDGDIVDNYRIALKFFCGVRD